MGSGGEETLAERVAGTRARQMGHSTADLHGDRPAGWFPGGTGEPAACVAPPPVKHCWYDGPHGRQAALLLEWRRLDGHYRGRIAVAALEPDGWAIVEMWVEQGMLTPT